MIMLNIKSRGARKEIAAFMQFCTWWQVTFLFLFFFLLYVLPIGTGARSLK